MNIRTPQWIQIDARIMADEFGVDRSKIEAYLIQKNEQEASAWLRTLKINANNALCPNPDNAETLAIAGEVDRLINQLAAQYGIGD